MLCLGTTPRGRRPRAPLPLVVHAWEQGLRPCAAALSGIEAPDGWAPCPPPPFSKPVPVRAVQGAFSVASKQQVPVVPITMDGTGDLMPNTMEYMLFPGAVKASGGGLGERVSLAVPAARVIGIPCAVGATARPCSLPTPCLLVLPADAHPSGHPARHGGGDVRRRGSCGGFVAATLADWPRRAAAAAATSPSAQAVTMEAACSASCSDRDPALVAGASPRDGPTPRRATAARQTGPPFFPFPRTGSDHGRAGVCKPRRRVTASSLQGKLSLIHI